MSSIKVDDDRSLRKSTIAKERIELRENSRVLGPDQPYSQKHIKETLEVVVQPIFGRRGYSIGHYARVTRADLLVMNAPEQAHAFGSFVPS